MKSNPFNKVMNVCRNEAVCTSYPKVIAMMVMRKPKKASSFLKPAQKQGLFIHLFILSVVINVSLKGLKHTVLVQEEEDKRVDDGDEDAAP